MISQQKTFTGTDSEIALASKSFQLLSKVMREEPSSIRKVLEEVSRRIEEKSSIDRTLPNRVEIETRLSIDKNILIDTLANEPETNVSRIVGQVRESIDREEGSALDHIDSLTFSDTGTISFADELHFEDLLELDKSRGYTPKEENAFQKIISAVEAVVSVAMLPFVSKEVFRKLEELLGDYYPIDGHVSFLLKTAKENPEFLKRYPLVMGDHIVKLPKSSFPESRECPESWARPENNLSPIITYREHKWGSGAHISYISEF